MPGILSHCSLGEKTAPGDAGAAFLLSSEDVLEQHDNTSIGEKIHEYINMQRNDSQRCNTHGAHESHMGNDLIKGGKDKWEYRQFREVVNNY